MTRQGIRHRASRLDHRYQSVRKRTRDIDAVSNRSAMHPSQAVDRPAAQSAVKSHRRSQRPHNSLVRSKDYPSQHDTGYASHVAAHRRVSTGRRFGRAHMPGPASVIPPSTV